MVMKIWNSVSHNHLPLSPSGPNNLPTGKEQNWARSSLYLPEFSKGKLLSRLKERLKRPKDSTSSSYMHCREPVNSQNGTVGRMWVKSEGGVDSPREENRCDKPTSTSPTASTDVDVYNDVGSLLGNRIKKAQEVCLTRKKHWSRT